MLKLERAVSFPIKKPLQKTSTRENLLSGAYPQDYSMLSGRSIRIQNKEKLLLQTRRKETARCCSLG